MPGIVSRSGSRRRKSINEINMVPFIDVMLVLLIIFMVTAPLITTGVVDLPSVGKSQQRPTRVVEIVVGSDEKLRLHLLGGDSAQEPQAVTLAQLAARVAQAQGSAGVGAAGATAAGKPAEVPVIISADRNVKYDSVVRVMDILQRAGVQRVGLSVRQAGS